MNELEPKENPLASEQPSPSVPDTDEKLDSAIDDIQHKESDILLEAETQNHAAKATSAHRTLKEKLGSGLKHIWNTKKLRYSLLGLLLAVVVTLCTVPTTRYGMLNLVHVRVSSSLVIRDDKTTLPLKNVEVTLAGKIEKTDREGKVQFTGLKQGKTVLEIKKNGYATKSQERTLGWGSNPLGDISIQATGTRFSFKILDWLSSLPISNAEASAGENAALSNDKGEIELVIEPTEASELSVTIKADNYLEQKVTIRTNSRDVKEMKLVLATPHYFVSKRSGTYDIYQVNVDGSNEKQLLVGTGRERDDMQFVVDQKNAYGALASSRENVRNKDGYLLTTLTLLDLKNNKDALKVDSGEQVNILGWIDGKLVYLKTVAGTSGANPNRTKLIAYSPADSKSKELASANYFSTAEVLSDYLYYAAANYYNEVPEPYLFRIKPDGTYKSIVLKSTGNYSVERYAYDKLYITTYQPSNGQTLKYDYAFGSASATKITEEPKSHADRLYTDSPDGLRAAWTDVRDGKGNLLLYTKSNKEDKIILTKPGITGPLHWLNSSTLVFRVVTQGESADYVINVDAEKLSPVKITDVTNVPRIYQGLGY